MRQESEATGKTAGAVGAVVLGAARSGTSAITGMLVAAGFFAGRDQDLLGPAHSNPVGHYELISLLKANEELVARLGGSYWADTPLPADQLPHRDEMVPALRRIVDSLIDTADGAPIVIKDPRINRLLPLWTPVIDNTLHPVLAIRDPLEVALSQVARDWISISHALATWEAQMTAVLHCLEGRVVTIAPYADIASRPELAADLVREISLYIDAPHASQLHPAEAVASLNPHLHRQHKGGLAHEDCLTGHQAALWKYLSNLGTGNACLAAPARLRDVSALAQEALRKESERVQFVRGRATEVFDAAEQARQETSTAVERANRAECAATEAKTRLREVETELSRARASVSWRATAPLRRLACPLRGRRSR